ncbi:MAG TPA: phosphotransferase [Solirubrobacteraceae bacterium]|nr:phosphotransferase [Solirubrobacteraceae bacterium]
MAESLNTEPGPVARRLDHDRLRVWLPEQRWFAAKSQTITSLDVVEEAAVGEGLALALLQVHFANGSHELYQLLTDPAGDELDVLTDGPHAHHLLAAIDDARELGGRHGRFCFRHVRHEDEGPPAPADPTSEPVRPMGAEQSNSSIVFGERLALKLFRRLEPGINPELEMLRFLTAHEYANIAPLYGWCEYEGEALAATLAVAQQFVVGGADGWELALDEIPRAPEAFLERIAELGTATARLHSVLATDAADPAFSPQDPSTELLNLLRATLDDQLEKVFGHLPDDPSVEPIVGLEQSIREHITLPAQGPVGGKSIRIHGDFHLGQTLYTGQGWTLLDFEGEPARPLNARRQKRSPLRDVASMLRSFSYAAWAVRLQRGQAAPEDFEARARQAFLDAYFGCVDPALLPTGQAQIQGLLGMFELEKALYELQYELDNRPEWVPIPVAGILRIVEAG